MNHEAKAADNSARTGDGATGFEDLLQRASKGSDAAVWELLERYHKNILRAARRHLPAEIRSKMDSVDIVQSVWKSLLRKGPDFGEFATIEALVAYLMGMARFKAIEHHRRFTKSERSNVRREREFYLDSPSVGAGGKVQGQSQQRYESPSVVAEMNECWRKLLRSDPRAEAVITMRLQRKSHDEIASEMNLSKSTVRRILDSMLQSLQA